MCLNYLSQPTRAFKAKTAPFIAYKLVEVKRVNQHRLDAKSPYQKDFNWGPGVKYAGGYPNSVATQRVKQVAELAYEKKAFGAGMIHVFASRYGAEQVMKHEFHFTPGQRRKHRATSNRSRRFAILEVAVRPEDVLVAGGTNYDYNCISLGVSKVEVTPGAFAKLCRERA